MSSTDVEYRQLGKSGLKVSVPIIGAMSFGSKEWVDWVVEEEEAHKILYVAWSRGINTIDTANVYSNGLSEKIIASFITKYDIPRENLVIMTKVNGLVTKEIGTKSFMVPGIHSQRDYINHSGLSRAAIFNAVEASLKRLNTSYIDVLQIHRLDRSVPAEETMKALHDLVQSGKVRYIGASTMYAFEFQHLNHVAEKHGWTEFISMQPEYSLLYREEERELIRYCNWKGIGVIPYSPLASGDLARPLTVTDTARLNMMKGTPFERKLGEHEQTIVKRVSELAEKHKCSMSQIALAWIATKTTSPIVGLSSVSRLEGSIITGVSLSSEEIKYLEEEYKPMVPRYN
ncbi:NADP-dependent oxidoreductase domain-containing protein [Mycena floridula]|nr:NADP-dependent oxidoreductase domain-containing protein [Mycena floridula]